MIAFWALLRLTFGLVGLIAICIILAMAAAMSDETDPDTQL